jgi:hypothetical protein
MLYAPACNGSGSAAMPITPFLRNQAFESEHIAAMSEAFVLACTSLGLADRTDPITELVARHIIEQAQAGVRTANALYLYDG